jgi:hypothetical protein
MRLKMKSVLVLAATGVLLSAGTAPVAMATVTAAPVSPAAAHCEDDGHGHGDAARVRSKNAAEPAQDPNAKAYGNIKAKPYLGDGTVKVRTVFHMIQPASKPSSRTNAEWRTLIDAQMKVMNDSFGGKTGGADTPFRFTLADSDVRFVKNDAWYNVVPGKGERDMKSALYTGNSETLNVYAADIGGGLLGWAYFPKGYNNGRDYIDGVVMLDESMPGGTAGKYALGDTLVHETGHWLALHHTFNAGCSASNDFVTDTPKEAYPQFDCPPDSTDTCTAPGTDPIHNFMDYTQDSCMYQFTKGQAQRMNDAWVNFRDV